MPTYRGNGGAYVIGGMGVPTYKGNGAPMYREKWRCLRIGGIGLPTYRGNGGAYVIGGMGVPTYRGKGGAYV